MRRSSLSRLVVVTSCLVGGSIFLSSPAEAQRRKASSAGAAAEAKPKKRKAAQAAPPPAAAAPVADAPADAAAPAATAAPVAPAPAPAPVAEAPAPMPAPAPAPPPPAPVTSKRPRQNGAAAVDETTTTTDLPPPPQRSLRKKSHSGGDMVDDDGAPIRRSRGARRDDDDDAPASGDDAGDKSDDESSDKASADAEPEPDSDTDTDADSEANKRRRPKPYLLDITAALRGFQRHFSYADDPNNELPNYDLGAAPAIAIDVGVYPFKNKTGSLSAGFTGSFEYAVGIGTTYKGPTGGQEGTHGTSAMAYAVGVRGNYGFGKTLGNIVSLGAEFGGQSFTIDHPPPVRGNANIPSVDYKFIRPNVQGRFPIMERLNVLGSLGYLMVSSAGEIVSADYFRGATSSASGIDLGLGVAYELRTSGKGTFKFLELRPMLTFRRYTFKFNPAVDDPFVSSGATDDYVGLNLGIATRL